MGEIKSTLDLVMERTRHLSMSSEEKAKQQRADFEKRLAGLLQKYDDKALKMAELLNQIKHLQGELKISEPETIEKAILSRIDPDQDNAHWLALIDNLMPPVCDPLKNILGVYNDQKALLFQKSERVLLDRLNRFYGIRGSAVIPNPHKDAQFQKEISALQNNTQAKIASIST
jgi:hypothetical protein